MCDGDIEWVGRKEWVLDGGRGELIKATTSPPSRDLAPGQIRIRIKCDTGSREK